MAFGKKEVTRKPADAFMNIAAVDKNGNKHKLGGLPLDFDKAAHKGIADKLIADPEATITLVYEVRLVQPEPTEPVAF